MGILFMALSTIPSYSLKEGTFMFKVGSKETHVWPKGVVSGEKVQVGDCKAQQEPIVKLMQKRYPEQDLEIILLCTPPTINNVIEDIRLMKLQLGSSEIPLEDLKMDFPGYRCRKNSENRYNYLTAKDLQNGIWNQQEDKIEPLSEITESIVGDVLRFYGKEEDGWQAYNAFSYFLERLRLSYKTTEFWKLVSTHGDEETPVFLYGNELWKERKDGELWELKSGKTKLLVRIVTIKEEAPSVGVKNAVTEIRKVFKEKDGEPFWIDIHGGLRSIMMVSNMIMTLLSQENIAPERILSIATRDNRITSEEHTYELEMFISGMNDFIKYGRADTLLAYYQSEGETVFSGILKAMEEISIGTQLSDPDGYESGLQKLRSAINKLDVEKEKQIEGIGIKENYFSIFENLIREDFGKLLEPSYTTMDIIERCFKKKLYQQALTFVEAKMPEEYALCGILDYGNGIGKESKDLDELLQSVIQADPMVGYKSNYNYLFDKFVEAVTRRWKNDFSMRDIIEQYSYGETEKEWSAMKDVECPLSEIPWEIEICAPGAITHLCKEYKRVKMGDHLPSGQVEKGKTLVFIRARKGKKNPKVQAYEVEEQTENVEDEKIYRSKPVTKASAEFDDDCKKMCGDIEEDKMFSWYMACADVEASRNIQLTCSLALTQEIREKILKLLILHAALRSCRNKFNHASNEGRANNRSILKALEDYIVSYKEMLSTYPVLLENREKNLNDARMKAREFQTRAAENKKTITKQQRKDFSRLFRIGEDTAARIFTESKVTSKIAE